MKNYLKRNKPLLLLPLVLIPFVVLIFYIMGGGSAKQVEDQSQIKNDSVRGANYSLPDADRDIKIYDKMEAVQSQSGLTQTHDYNISGDKDSVTENLLKIPDGTKETTETRGTVETTERQATENSETDRVKSENSANKKVQLNAENPDDLLEHIRKRESQIRKDLMDEPKLEHKNVVQEKGFNQGKSTATPEKQSETADPKIDTDPVIPTGIMELDKVFTQNKRLIESNDSLNRRLNKADGQLKKLEEEKSKHFVLEKSGVKAFGNPNSERQASPGMVPIRAEIYETETVLTGNRVKLRLLEDCNLNGIKICRNTFVYGACTVNNERLEVNITQLPMNGIFIPVRISIYDLDGQKGLYVPDNASRKVAKEAGSSVNTSSMFGVTGNPLMYAGIQAADRAAQSVIKMIRIKRVTVKKNTLVYLVNQNN